MSHYNRSLKNKVREHLASMPAVFINGPRQSGKSTLSREIANEIKAGYLTFDDLSTFSAATQDPAGFISGLRTPIVLDEIQMVPDIFRLLKKTIDESRYNNQPNSHHPNGQFLLTGSANIMALPQLSDALVGRMSVLTLYPLSMSEIHNKQAGFINALFNISTFYFPHTLENMPLSNMIKMATYPQIINYANNNATEWFDSYLTTLLQREIRVLSEIEKINAIPQLLRLFATRVGSNLNDASVARDCGLNVMTYRRYRMLLQNVFLFRTIPPWFRNINKRLVKSPKAYFIDTGLLQYAAPGLDTGHLLENFVATELFKQLTLSPDYSLYYFRTQEGSEIDFIIERRDGKLIAIEVKSRETVMANDFLAIKMLQAEIGDDFMAGVVLYNGNTVLPFGNKLYALPISALWKLQVETP